MKKKEKEQRIFVCVFADVSTPTKDELHGDRGKRERKKEKQKLAAVAASRVYTSSTLQKGKKGGG
jgi:hypothetical protein